MSHLVGLVAGVDDDAEESEGTTIPRPYDIKRGTDSTDADT